jgi:hypothetical protein
MRKKGVMRIEVRAMTGQITTEYAFMRKRRMGRNLRQITNYGETLPAR